MRNFLIKNIRKISLPLLLIFIFVFGACKQTGTLRHAENIRNIKKSPKNLLVAESVISPSVSDSISLNSLTVKERKKEFLRMMVPSVLVVKSKLDLTRERVILLENKKKLTPSDKMFLEKLEKEYKTQDLKVLAKRLHTFPVSIVLAQAAIESGWGTSRFFQEANNPFGMWSFSDSHARMKALSVRSGENVYLRKFNNLESSIQAYYMLLATGRTFQDFRNMKMKTDQPLKLIQTLNTYSEKGNSYVTDLANLIIYNNLQKYDDYETGQQYLAEEVK
jgi:Bax protein